MTQLKVGDLVTTTILGKEGNFLVLDISRTGLCLLWEGKSLWKFKSECEPVGQKMSV